VIQHVVILVRQNRSFDHYFGTLRGVRGFADPGGLFGQPSGTLCGGTLYPFRLDTDPSKNGECTNDITHSWGPQHRSWDGGAMDRFVLEHMADDPNNGYLTMGYTKTNLAAKAFTPRYPETFEADVAAGTLPQVSWILAHLVDTEHPPAPVSWGEDVTHQVVSTLTSNPDVWRKTALFVTYDEN